MICHRRKTVLYTAGIENQAQGLLQNILRSIAGGRNDYPYKYCLNPSLPPNMPLPDLTALYLHTRYGTFLKVKGT